VTTPLDRSEISPTIPDATVPNISGGRSRLGTLTTVGRLFSGGAAASSKRWSQPRRLCFEDCGVACNAMYHSTCDIRGNHRPACARTALPVRQTAPVTNRDGLPHLDAGTLSRLLPYEAAIAALGDAFARIDEYTQLPRGHVPLPGGELLMMPASGPEGMGVKLVTLNPNNRSRGKPLIDGVYVLFAPDTFTPEATVDGSALTAIRTAAVSALATRHLARADARRLLVFGAGVQAAAHITAICAVRPIDHVVIVGTGSPRTHRLRETVRSQGLACDLGTPADAASADIICTCTTSPTPLFPGVTPAEGTYINAVGAYRPHLRELHTELFTSARVVVETREAALAEAGDVIVAASDGALSPDDLIELGHVIGGRVKVPEDGALTIFKSVGVGMEDLVVARCATRRLARGHDHHDPTP
jgi:ornithine cyclodeaminase/alanine dehydrogenase-like protein (mu-crystallin family)